MLLQGPGIPAGQIIADPVSTLDLMPTFCDFANLPVADHLQGESLAPLIAGTPGVSREVAYNEWFVHKSRMGTDLDLRAVRTETHKCTFEMISGAGELYDLVNDPTEMNNLYEDPGSIAIRKALEEMMRARPGPRLENFAPQIGMA